MDMGRKKAYGRSGGYGMRFLVRSVLVLAAVAAIGTTILCICSGVGRKLDANRIASPWDASKAPPQFVLSRSVRVVKPHEHAPSIQQAMQKTQTRHDRGSKRAWRRVEFERIARNSSF